MLKVIDFIIGYLLGYSQNMDQQIYEDEIKNSKYVPKFTGYYSNEGTRYNEDWKWIEPQYRKRYLNIFKDKRKLVLRGSWIKDKSADECIICKNQGELEIEVNIQNRIEFEREIIYETKDELVYLNVELNEDIRISIDRFKKEDCFDSISCLDMEEAEELLENMEDHYRKYRHVKTIDNVNA
ncbi:hypothetical protein [Clostridium beijerinckii]|uniref:hypothetical protein n=1 Tax=Clostridium beijerinckii TaxID=1520 RepID=UPI0022DEEA3A|nr:hypothetical protein [Clostridium beijerinckii]